MFKLLASLFLVQGEHLAINWTEANTAGSGTESHLEDPAVKPLAPCPCDMTLNFCDSYCCCDKDCSSHDTAAFSCLEGLGGGHTTDKILDNNCKYRGPYSPEWHDFLCFIKENNPYLGLFYKAEASIRDFQKYLSRIKSPKYSYEDSASVVQDQESHPYYILGSNVEIAILTNDTVIKGVLSLPQQVLHGICINTMPIHFLENFSHKCPVVLSPEACKKESLLSSTSYLQEADEVNPYPYSIYPQVIGNLTNLQVVSTSVEYECLQDSRKFIKVQGLNRIPQELPSDFRETDEEYITKDCDANRLPFYNETSHMCENVVLSVEYSMGWRGPFISQVHAKIILGDVAVSLEGLYSKEYNRDSLHKENIKNVFEYPQHRRKYVALSANHRLSLLQHFTLRFHHLGYSNTSDGAMESALNDSDSNMVDLLESALSGDDNNLVTNENFGYFPSLYERSGNPGYEPGKPVLGGYAVYDTTSGDDNTTSESLLFVDINHTTGLYIWRPDTSGECKNSLVESVSFGVDMISACIYHWKNISNCGDLRENIQSVLYSLIRSDVVSKLGWPNVTSESDFLPIIKDSDEKMNISDSEDCQVPFSLEYKILYRDVNDIPRSALSIYQILGIYARLHYREMQLREYVSERSTTLTSSITFLNHPRLSELSRFWEAMQDRWCSGGTCWREILRPWTHGNVGDGVPTSEGLYSSYIINLVANSAMVVLFVFPLAFLTLRHSYQLTFSLF